MKLANLAGRAVLITDDGAVDIADASGGSLPADPAALYERWEELVAWFADAATNGSLGDPQPFDETA